MPRCPSSELRSTTTSFILLQFSSTLSKETFHSHYTAPFAFIPLNSAINVIAIHYCKLQRLSDYRTEELSDGHYYTAGCSSVDNNWAWTSAVNPEQSKHPMILAAGGSYLHTGELTGHIVEMGTRLSVISWNERYRKWIICKLAQCFSNEWFYV